MRHSLPECAVSVLYLLTCYFYYIYCRNYGYQQYNKYYFNVYCSVKKTKNFKLFEKKKFYICRNLLSNVCQLLSQYLCNTIPKIFLRVALSKYQMFNFDNNSLTDGSIVTLRDMGLQESPS